MAVLGKYTEEEILCLLDYFCDLRDYKHKLYIMIRMADIERTFSRLTEKEKTALFYHHVMALNYEETGKLTNCKPDTVRVRCRKGIERLLRLLNRGGSGR